MAIFYITLVFVKMIDPVGSNRKVDLKEQDLIVNKAKITCPKAICLLLKLRTCYCCVTFGSQSATSCPAQSCVFLWSSPLYLSTDLFTVLSYFLPRTLQHPLQIPGVVVTACLMPNQSDPTALSPRLPLSPGPVAWPAPRSGCDKSHPPRS